MRWKDRQRGRRACAGMCAAVLAMVTGSAASAGVTVNVAEVGGDVVFTGAGTLDITAWSFLKTGPRSPAINTDFVVTGPGGDLDLYELPINFAGPASIPANPTFADFGSGDMLGLDFDQFVIGVPVGYVSGDPIASSATFESHSLVTLGLTEGVYTWTWDTASGGSDFFMLRIVPAPGALTMFTVAGIAMKRRRRRP